MNEEITELLDAWTDGDSDALNRLLPLITDDLRTLAGRYLALERPGHTLQPTALVNEAYLKLVERRNVHVKSRVELFAVLSQTLRPRGWCPSHWRSTQLTARSSRT